MVAAAVVEVQVCVDDDVDGGEVEGLIAEWNQPGIHVGHRRMQLGHTGVDQDARVGMVDDVHVDGPALALDEQLGHEQRRDRRWRRHPPILTTFSRAGSLACLSRDSRHESANCSERAVRVVHRHAADTESGARSKKRKWSRRLV